MHFIRYCQKICKTNNISTPYLSVDNYSHYVWSLKHETVFKRSNIKPPYAVLINAIKTADSISDILFLFGDYLDELKKLRYGNCSLRDCPNITKYELFIGGAYDITYGSWGYSKPMLRFLDQIQGKSGVYKLYDIDKNLLYIGKSYTLSNRLTASIKEQRAYYCRAMVTNTQSDANLLEVFYISEEKPPNNDAGFTFDKLTIDIKHKYKFSPLIKIYTDGYEDKRHSTE